MTVCIAALADDEKSVVLASDKMISQQMPAIEYEHDIEKIVSVSDDFYVLIAGAVNNAVDIIERAKLNIKADDTVDSKFEGFRKAYIDFRTEKIEKVILNAQGFQSLQDFQSKQNVLAKEVCISIQNLINNANLQTILILVALDNQKCYLRVLNHPGDLINPLEYATIGIGDLYATQSLIGAKYKKKEELNTATYLVFEAKKKSEVAPGVGSMTDIIILHHDKEGKIKHRKLNDDDFKKLENVYRLVNNRDAKKIKNLLDKKNFSI